MEANDTLRHVRLCSEARNRFASSYTELLRSFDDLLLHLSAAQERNLLTKDSSTIATWSEVKEPRHDSAGGAFGSAHGPRQQPHHAGIVAPLTTNGIEDSGHGMNNQAASGSTGTNWTPSLSISPKDMPGSSQQMSDIVRDPWSYATPVPASSGSADLGWNRSLADVHSADRMAAGTDVKPWSGVAGPDCSAKGWQVGPVPRETDSAWSYGGKPWKTTGAPDRARAALGWNTSAAPRESGNEWSDRGGSWQVASQAPEANGTNRWDFLRSGPSTKPQSIISAHRGELEISVAGEMAEPIAPISEFQELQVALPKYVLDALRLAGIMRPMAIQAQALPIALKGFDMIGIAKTGSGKTLAFILPALAHIEAQPVAPHGDVASPVALVLAPVRELAVQIAEEANKLVASSTEGAHSGGVGAIALYGGGQRVRWEQVQQLQSGWSQLVVGTPGRICDFLSSGELSLQRVSLLVLDEADRMLEEGLGDQLTTIQNSAIVQSDRQTLFFSATWPLRVQELAAQMCLGAAPIQIKVGQPEEAGAGPSARSDIVQEVVVFRGKDWTSIAEEKKARLDAHLRTLLQNMELKVLVFVGTKNMTWELAEQLNTEGFSADFMYGGRSQDQRHEVVRKFKEGITKLLVTTDVMARGLDIPGVSHVVVYDCYGDIEEYVHRIGRTARGPYGQGHALTFYEYHPKYSEFPSELIRLLEECMQTVPPELRGLADEVKAEGYQSKWTSGWRSDR